MPCGNITVNTKAVTRHNMTKSSLTLCLLLTWLSLGGLISCGRGRVARSGMWQSVYCGDQVAQTETCEEGEIQVTTQTVDNNDFVRTIVDNS